MTAESIDPIFNPELQAALKALLQHGTEELGVRLYEQQLSQLMQYLGLLQKWNQVYNLTAVRKPMDMLHQHLLDSLSAVPALQRQLQTMPISVPVRVLDVGAGAGLPGVALAIAMPELAVTCVDTVGKKVAFVQQVAAGLGLKNLAARHARVETLTTHDWPIICSRAFASLADFTNWTQQALAPGGVWMAMKGKTPTEEFTGLSASVEVFHVEPLQVPGLADTQRCLVWMRQRLLGQA